MDALRMDSLGWLLFLIGALLLVVFAFFGIDVGGGSVMNLSGTLVGSAMMISGAVFVAGARIEQALKKGANLTSTTTQPLSSYAPSTKASGHIKNYKGYELTRGEGGVYVNGKQFPDVLAAEKWINEQVKKL